MARSKSKREFHPFVVRFSNTVFDYLSARLNKIVINKIVIPKKVELLIQFFEPFWISRVFHFFLRTFGEVEHLPDPLGASDKTYTQSKIDISGSNETIQNALASIF